MADKPQPKGWNPYLAGSLAGIVAVLSVVIGKNFLGASTTFAKSACMVESVFAKTHVQSLEYFQKFTGTIDWQWMFVFGIMIGSFISAITSNSFKWQNVPDMWNGRFGNSTAKRAVFAFIGGVIAIIGARLADGCPSGHGLSGIMQLSVSGFIAMIGFFGGGIVMAQLLYKGRK